ncbi:MAG: hypothetical protein R3236_10465, partial [Phycisphaeraceae bacterium]|nr:hypothetical protein [Phycisphaeraceae bacterium]
RDPRRLSHILLLSDGRIGPDPNLLNALAKDPGDSHLLSFGVGPSPDHYLLCRLAKTGRGAVAFPDEQADGAEAMGRLIKRLRRPTLSRIEIDWGPLQVRHLQPARIPDLFFGRPLILTGRFGGGGKARLHVRGRAGGQWVSMSLPVDLNRAGGHHPALEKIWARRRIAALMDQSILNPGSVRPEQIRRLALRHGLVSAYTAFVTVDARRR